MLRIPTPYPVPCVVDDADLFSAGPYDVALADPAPFDCEPFDREPFDREPFDRELLDRELLDLTLLDPSPLGNALPHVRPAARRPTALAGQVMGLVQAALLLALPSGGQRTARCNALQSLGARTAAHRDQAAALR